MIHNKDCYLACWLLMDVDPEAQLRNIKDFLLVYNTITEKCFWSCVTNMNDRNMTFDEQVCVHNCTMRFIRSGYRFMSEFAKLTPEMVKRRNEDALEQARKVGLSLEGSDISSVEESSSSVAPGT